MAAPIHVELFARFKPDCVVPTGAMVDGLDEAELDDRRSVNAGEGRRVESVFWNVHPLAQQVGIVGRDVANLFDGNHPCLAWRSMVSRPRYAGSSGASAAPAEGGEDEEDVSDSTVESGSPEASRNCRNRSAMASAS